MIVFSTPASEKMARAICAELNFSHISLPLKKFSGGEFDLCVDLPDLRGKKSIFVHSLGGALHDNWMALFLLSRRIKQAGSTHLTAILPYMAYGRQDKSDQEGHTPFELIAFMIQTCGIDCIHTLDLHVPQLKNFFSIELVDIQPHLVFSSLWPDRKGCVVISPDKGSHTRARHLAQILRGPWVQLTKTRVQGKPPLISGETSTLINGNTCLIVDDILDTGGTLSATVAYLKKQGAVHISACITHCLGSSICLDQIAKSGLDHLYTSDSVPVQDPPSWMSVLSTASLFAASLKKDRRG